MAIKFVPDTPPANPKPAPKARPAAQIAEGLQEALAVAKGEAKPHREHIRSKKKKETEPQPAANPAPDGWITRKEAAAQAGVSFQLLDYWVKRYGIPRETRDGSIMIFAAAVTDIAKAHKTLKARRTA